MRNIQVKSWKEKGKDGTEISVDTTKALGVLLASRPPDKMPRGLDNFRLFSRVSKAFDDAQKTGFIKLEEADYSFIKKILEEDLPASWGANPEVFEAISLFLEAKQEGV